MTEQQRTGSTRSAAERNTAYPETAATGAPAGSPATAQGTAMLAMLAGLWVAISPWVLIMPALVAHNLIVGLAVVAFCLLALAGSRGFTSLQGASLLTGVWVLISPWLLGLTAEVSTQGYWSNIIAGAVIIALSVLSGGVAGVSALRRG